MTDAELLRAAIDASGVRDTRTGEPSTRGFALRVLHLDESNARQVLEGTKTLGRGHRVLCVLVIQRPDLVDDISLAVAHLTSEQTA